MDKETLQELKVALESEQKRLVTELKFIANPDPSMAGNWNAKYPKFEAVETGSSSSFEEEQDEFEEYEVRLEAEHSLESRLLAINKALERIKTETYGKCAKCKKEISLERLKANPSAEFDIEHSN